MKTMSPPSYHHNRLGTRSVHDVPKCVSLDKAIEVITERAH